MKNSYQSKPIPLFTHYNGKYSKLRFYFPALHRKTRQAAHSFRQNACAHHTLRNFFFFTLYTSRDARCVLIFWRFLAKIGPCLPAIYRSPWLAVLLFPYPLLAPAKALLLPFHVTLAGTMWLLILAKFWRQDTTKSQSTKECVLDLKLPALIQLDFTKHTKRAIPWLQ